MKPLPITEARSMSKKTPTKETIDNFNSLIKSAASEYKNIAEIDLSHVSGVSDNIYKNEKIKRDQRSYMLTGKDAFECLPQHYRDAVELFNKAGYKFEFRADVDYNSQPFEEGYEDSFRMKIKW